MIAAAARKPIDFHFDKLLLMIFLRLAVSVTLTWLPWWRSSLASRVLGPESGERD
jgi:hypothetical protein